MLSIHLARRSRPFQLTMIIDTSILFRAINIVNLQSFLLFYNPAASPDIGACAHALIGSSSASMSLCKTLNDLENPWRADINIVELTRLLGRSTAITRSQ